MGAINGSPRGLRSFMTVLSGPPLMSINSPMTHGMTLAKFGLQSSMPRDKKTMHWKNFPRTQEMSLQFMTKRYSPCPEPNTKPELYTMKVLSSLASMKRRHADCQIVKRKGTLYVICKSNPKFKARQGATAGTRLSKKGVK